MLQNYKKLPDNTTFGQIFYEKPQFPKEAHGVRSTWGEAHGVRRTMCTWE